MPDMNPEFESDEAVFGKAGLSDQAYDFSGTVFTEWSAKEDHFTAWRDWRTKGKSAVGFITKSELGGCFEFETHNSRLTTSEIESVARFMRWLSRGKQ